MNIQNRINKTYNELNADQMAALGFHYLSKGNKLEFKRLAAAVPQKSYRGPDETYQARLDGLYLLTMSWSNVHWRLRHDLAQTLVAIQEALRKKSDDEEIDYLIGLNHQTAGCLLGLDAALSEICRSKGVDPADIWRMADSDPYKSNLEFIKPDLEMQAAMHAAFTRLMDEYYK
jgi:hypothetical protein